MKVAAVTITYNRLDLTKRTYETFNQKTGVDLHLFVDNGSTDGTLDWLKDKYRIEIGKNVGITMAFAYAVSYLSDYDYILKLDNDVETTDEDTVGIMIRFIEKYGSHALSPVDRMIDPAFYPNVLKQTTIGGYKIQYTSHTGGAYQVAPTRFVKQLMADLKHFKAGDYAIGGFYRHIGCPPAYMLDLGMNHIGLNQSTPAKDYIL